MVRARRGGAGPRAPKEAEEELGNDDEELKAAEAIRCLGGGQDQRMLDAAAPSSSNHPSRAWRPFAEARAFAQGLKLKGQVEWYQWHKSGKRPYDIPSNPDRAYQGKGWSGFGDWLGTGTVCFRNIDFRPFAEARDYARGLKLRNVRAWEKWRKTDARPFDVPSHPDKTYKDDGWSGYGDWLGTGATATTPWRPFAEARAYVHSLKLQDWKEWQQFSKSRRRPFDVPSHPNKAYRDKGWSSMGDWLGCASPATDNAENEKEGPAHGVAAVEAQVPRAAATTRRKRAREEKS